MVCSTQFNRTRWCAGLPKDRVCVKVFSCLFQSEEFKRKATAKLQSCIRPLYGYSSQEGRNVITSVAGQADLGSSWARLRPQISLFRLDVRDEPYNSVLHRQDDLESAKNKRVKVCNSHQMLRKWCGQWWSRTEVFALHLGMIRERLWAGAPAIGGTELPTPQVVSRQREPQCGFGALAPHQGPGPEVLDSFHRRSSRLLSS